MKKEASLLLARKRGTLTHSCPKLMVATHELDNVMRRLCWQGWEMTYQWQLSIQIQSGSWFEGKWGADASMSMRVRNRKFNLPYPAFQPPITWLWWHHVWWQQDFFIWQHTWAVRGRGRRTERKQEFCTYCNSGDSGRVGMRETHERHHIFHVGGHTPNSNFNENKKTENDVFG